MPVKKLHVKGKRKAPLPPTALNLLPKESTNNVENKFTENNGESSSVISSQFKRKKAAPLPPSNCLSNELNNFSDKLNDKCVNGSINLNIFERNDLQFMTKQINDTKCDQNGESLNFSNKENDQVWICNYCTLRNPFWKIVCDACERIKPYNTPNVPMLSAFDINYNKDYPENINVRSPIKMRTKTINVNKDPENVFKRSSMKVDELVEMKPKEQKIVNRPMSVCFSMNDKALNTPESLEVEKERIRALIRSMNNRALAKKYAAKPSNNVHEMAVKGGAIKKHPQKDKNKVPNKYDVRKDYNFPTRDNRAYDNYLSQTDDSKANFVKANQVQVTDNYFDQTILGSTSKASEAKRKDDNLVRFAKSPPRLMIGDNKLTLILYVNFNKAVEAKVHHRMTMNEFTNFISKNIAPSKCPKIYFNGLLLQNGEQRLINYGVKDRSSLYINTENVVAHTRNDVSSPIKLLYEKPKEETQKEVQLQNDIACIPAINDTDIKSTKNAGEKYRIEHIQFDQYTIEKINPEPVNLSKTKYRGVYNYNPRCNPDLTRILEEEKSVKKSTVKPIKCEQPILSPICDTMNQYMELLSLDDSMDLTKNTEVFECSICMVDYQPLEGVILRNCLHTFCKDCARNSIIYSDEAEVKCPYIDKDYSCEYFLQDREIKALLSKSEFDEHLAKSLRIAENQIENSFHCRTPNCKGWCIYEDDVNIFKCPICSLGNCLTCRVIHDGLDCKQYQTMMQNNADSNPENATTVKLLEEMVKNGEAMNCPTCRIVLMKKWGCDWLKCSMCKTEICWITRGPRWGPGGKGDTSAGCRCGVDGFRCHPKCTYCH